MYTISFTPFSEECTNSLRLLHNIVTIRRAWGLYSEDLVPFLKPSHLRVSMYKWCGCRRDRKQTFRWQYVNITGLFHDEQKISNSLFWVVLIIVLSVFSVPIWSEHRRKLMCCQPKLMLTTVLKGWRYCYCHCRVQREICYYFNRTFSSTYLLLLLKPGSLY